MRLHGRIASLLLVAALGWGACGSKSAGGASEPAEPAATTAPAGDEPAGDEDVLIPAEKLDQIQSFFERKNRMISGCFGDAMEAGEIPKDESRIHVTAQMTITEGGQLTGISFSDASVSSPVLEGCLREHMARWTLPTLPKPLDYSYTFGFSAL